MSIGRNYSTVSLPNPEFYTFYNGTESWGKEKVLRLSDSYMIQDGEPMLELVVKMINKEVVNMLIAKYDYETDIRVQREEAQEMGRAEGRVEGRVEGRLEGRLEGKELQLIELLKKKLAKGQTSVEIADALEESVEKVEEMIRLMP